MSSLEYCVYTKHVFFWGEGGGGAGAVLRPHVVNMVI